jgi:hypothetical protein
MTPPPCFLLPRANHHRFGPSTPPPDTRLTPVVQGCNVKRPMGPSPSLPMTMISHDTRADMATGSSWPGQDVYIEGFSMHSPLTDPSDTARWAKFLSRIRASFRPSELRVCGRYFEFSVAGLSPRLPRKASKFSEFVTISNPENHEAICMFVDKVHEIANSVGFEGSQISRWGSKISSVRRWKRWWDYVG